jgi:uncharacterized membrane-anchored protein
VPALRTRTRGRQASLDPSGEAKLAGTARLGRRTKELVKRLVPGEIAIIDHPDLDRISAEELLECGAIAVVNVSRSSTGRYPNAGPLLLATAGVHLVDAPGAPLFEELRDGDTIRLEGGRILAGEKLLATGKALQQAELALEMEHHRRQIGEALEDFAENTMAHIRQEREVLAGRIDFPRTRTSFRDRHVLIVVRGSDHKKDLRALRAYIRDVKPVLVGVDGGADAILTEGLQPDVVLGDMDSASDAVLGSGAELVVHAYADGRAPGGDRLRALGLDHTVVPAPGTSQDVAMLLAHEKGARLIVSVGTHFNLVEFLDKNRDGMSSTFLTRLRIGEVLVDAKGVSRLYNPGVSGSQLALFMAAFGVLLVIVVATSPVLDNLLELLWLKIRIALNI